MGLELNISDIKVTLDITGYKKRHVNSKSNPESDFDDWCKCNLSIEAINSNNEMWLNYHLRSKEILLSIEVDGLAKCLEKALNGELTENKHISLIEPDIEFNIISRKRIKRSNIGKGLDVPLQLEFIINFWDNNGALSANSLTLLLDEIEISRLLEYLKEVQSGGDTHEKN